MKRTLSILITLSIALSLGTPLVAAQQPTNSAIADDGEILSCSTITEPGDYYLGSNLGGNADDACLTIAHNESTVTIDGNGHTLQGPGTDRSIGLYIGQDYDAEGLEIHNITITGWDDGITHSTGDLSLHDATVTSNQQGYTGSHMSADFENVEFTNNENTAISTSTTLQVTMDNVQANNNGGGFSMIDGGGVTVTDSEFNNNENTGISVGHSMDAEFTNVEVSGNGGPGVGFSGTAMGTKGAFEDSTITNNGLDGIAVQFGPDRDRIDLTNVHIDGNERRAITAYDTENDRAVARVNATDVTLGGGLTVNFEQEAPILETTATDWSATDTINVAGEDDVAVATTFNVGGGNGQLWKGTNGEWSKQGEYSTSDGRFTETLSTGLWTADASEQVTPTPEPTPDQTPTETAEPMETDSGPAPLETTTPTETQTPTPPPSTPRRGTGGGGVSLESRTGTPTATNSRSSRSTFETGEPSTPIATDTATSTENDQVTEPPAGTQATTEKQTDTGTADEGAASEELPGFTGELALIALVAATLLVYRSAETR